MTEVVLITTYDTILVAESGVTEIVVQETFGPPGPPGPPGSGDKTFDFTQAVPSDTWVINHGLDKYPSVMILDSAGDEVEGHPIYQSRNTLIMEFTAAFSGVAYLN